MWKRSKCGREFKNTGQDHYCGKIDNIDAYIADQPEAHRAVILEAAPKAADRGSIWKMNAR